MMRSAKTAVERLKAEKAVALQTANEQLKSEIATLRQQLIETRAANANWRHQYAQVNAVLQANRYNRFARGVKQAQAAEAGKWM